MRRGPGVSGLKKRTAALTNYKVIGSELESVQLEQLTKQLSSFKSNLELFATNHKQQINANPIFRRQFQDMCQSVGVDPLASNRGFWSSLLGLGNYYYELAVQIVDICLSTRSSNGGLISINELLIKLNKHRKSNNTTINEISENDILIAVKKLACLGSGFRVIKLGNDGNNNNNTVTATATNNNPSISISKYMIISVPTELTNDHIIILELAESTGGYVNVQLIQSKLHWSIERIEIVLKLLIQQGMVWIDQQTESNNNSISINQFNLLNCDYYFPSISMQ